ncbi:MAG TPA: acyl-CoA thioesterase [Solirubrobacterales bacterium]|nr:acyl-CoA thioesterase [Solirubrobacterales bacterium]
MSDAREPRPASASRSELVRWMGIEDANLAGLVHGGVVMKMCDEVAAIAAIRHCGKRVVTASVDRMMFVDPVNVGELLACSATVNAAWRTSMEVGVRVEAENPRTGERRHTSTAYLTMVALDDHAKPTRVPELLTETDIEARRRREAELRRANRLAERDQIVDARDETAPG